MAHNIARVGGQDAIAYQGTTPWHELGERATAEEAADLDVMMRKAHLDYTVGTEPVYLKNGNVIPDRFAILRTDSGDVFDVVSDIYKPIQNAEYFGIYREAMKEFGMTVECAGALGHGERAWMLFKLPCDVTVTDGDVVRGYGLAVTGHNLKTAPQFLPTPIRVVCDNTLTAAFSRAGGANSDEGRVFRFQHLGDVATKIDDARKAVNGVIAAMKQTGETFSAMARRRMTPQETIAFIESVFPSGDNGEVSKQLETRRKTVADLVWSGVGAEMAGSDKYGTTAWAAYNAVTEYFDHVAPAVSKTDGGRRRANQSAVFGTGLEFKLAALKQAQRLLVAA